MRDLILGGPVDIVDAVGFGLTGRVEAILAEDPEALQRRFGGHALDAADEDGWRTPPAHAVIQGRAEMVRFLLERGADGRLRSPENRSLREIAERMGHAEVAELLG